MDRLHARRGWRPRASVSRAYALTLWLAAIAPAFAAPPPPLGSPLAGIRPPAAPSTAPPLPGAAEPAAIAPSAANEFFALDTVRLEGITAYPASETDPLLAGLTGPHVSLARIEAARSALLMRYRRDGYVYATVRARISARALVFYVVEPHVVGVKLSRDIGPAGTRVLEFLDHLADGRLLKQSDLERWVLLANDIPGVSVRVVLDPSATDPGALTLRAIVTRQAVSGSIRADNRAYQNTGPEELLSVVDLNSFTSLGEQSEFSIYHTFNNTDNFGQFSEQFFIGGSGLNMKLYFGYGEELPSGSLRQIGYDGITRVFGGALNYPLIRSRAHDLILSALFDGIESDILYSALGPGSRASFESLRVLSLNAADTLSDGWLGATMPALNVSGASIAQGLPILGASPNGGPQLPRLNENIAFTKGDLRIDRVQTLFSPFAVDTQPATVQLELAAEGQYTHDILPPEEEFYLGGPQFNRGFYYGQVTGDKAITAKVEPQLVTALPPLPYWGLRPQATFYGFFDWGETWQNQAADPGHILRSLGGGVRLALGALYEIDLEGVSRLTRTPNGPPPQGTRLNSAAFYWQVIGRF